MKETTAGDEPLLFTRGQQIVIEQKLREQREKERRAQLRMQRQNEKMLRRMLEETQQLRESLEKVAAHANKSDEELKTVRDDMENAKKREAILESKLARAMEETAALREREQQREEALKAQAMAIQMLRTNASLVAARAAEQPLGAAVPSIGAAPVAQDAAAPGPGRKAAVEAKQHIGEGEAGDAEEPGSAAGVAANGAAAGGAAEQQAHRMCGRHCSAVCSLM